MCYDFFWIIVIIWLIFIIYCRLLISFCFGFISCAGGVITSGSYMSLESFTVESFTVVGCTGQVCALIEWDLWQLKTSGLSWSNTLPEPFHLGGSSHLYYTSSQIGYIFSAGQVILCNASFNLLLDSRFNKSFSCLV